MTTRSTNHSQSPRQLRIFLCHATSDKPAVRDLYRRLNDNGFQPWLTAEDLRPDQDWETRIRKAVRVADVIIVNLSHNATSPQGRIHREVKIALDEAEKQPPGATYIIPLRLEACDVPQRLRRWRWVNLHEDDGYERLTRILTCRAQDLGLALPVPVLLSKAAGTPLDPPKPTLLPFLNPRDPHLVKARGLIALKQWSEALQWYETLAAEFTLPQQVTPYLERARHEVWRLRTSAQAEEAEARRDLETAVALWTRLAERLPDDRTIAARLERARGEQHLAERAQNAADLVSQTEWEAILAVVQQIERQRPGYRHPMIDLAALQQQAQVALDYEQAVMQAEQGDWPAVIATLAAVPDAVASDDLRTLLQYARAMVVIPEMISVPAGYFLMGSSRTDMLVQDDEQPQHTVRLPTYWIGTTPVTNAQFRSFVEGDGYHNCAYWTRAGWSWREQQGLTSPRYWHNPTWNGDDQPVVGVSWFEAVAYCRWLSTRTCHPFHLPTEAEWEKAARGSKGRIWPWGNTWATENCNCDDPFGFTSPVRQYLRGASPYGVLDMAGNVWEWCATIKGKSYPYQIEDEWADAYLEQHTARAIRGGSWLSKNNTTRTACRNSLAPRHREDRLGLRIATHSLPPGQGR